MLQLVRSSRLRRRLVWSCVSYLLLSVSADFLHGHTLLSPGSPTVGIAHQVVSAPAQRSHRSPYWSCAICQWQRVATGLHVAPLVSANLSTVTVVLTVIAAFPKSPVPHPSAFRGPPQLSFS